MNVLSLRLLDLSGKSGKLSVSALLERLYVRLGIITM